MKILIVDDDKSVLRAITRVLRAAGHEVTHASSYEEAVGARKATGELDVLITDYHLGDGKTGSDVVNECPGIPFILMSGDADVIPCTFKEQAEELLDKPFEVHHLMFFLSKLGRRTG